MQPSMQTVLVLCHANEVIAQTRGASRWRYCFKIDHNTVIVCSHLEQLKAYFVMTDETSFKRGIQEPGPGLSLDQLQCSPAFTRDV